MAFDWLRFVQVHRIDYVESGPSVVAGHIAVACPFCGSADPSQHMGLCIEGPKKGYWGCWRAANHRGKHPQKLIQALLGCSHAEANRIAGVRQAPELGSDETMGTELQSLLADHADDPTKQGLQWPAEMKPVKDDGGFGELFLRYLTDERGYGPEDAQDLCRVYGLRYAVRGPYAYRLLVPVRMPDVGLSGWTGRSIYKAEGIRYRSLSHNPDKAAKEGLPSATHNIHDCLFNLKQLLTDEDASTLVVVEGPLDALRVDYYGQPRLRATCLFSKTVSAAQLDWLGQLAPRFANRLLLLDGDAKTDAFGLYTQLEPFGFSYKLLPGKKDPAEMTPREIRQLAQLAGRGPQG